jgi:AcrR family transcriptional regulator
MNLCYLFSRPPRGPPLPWWNVRKLPEGASHHGADRVREPMTPRIAGTGDTRTALLEASLYCFADHGFDATSIRMIAEKAARPLSLISHHFGSKEGLYLETFRFLMQNSELQNLAAMSTDRHPRNRAEAIRQFRESIHLLYTTTTQPAFQPNLFHDAGRRLWLREMPSPRPEILELITTTLGPWRIKIEPCVHLLRPDLDEAEIAFLGSSILGLVVGHGLLSGMSRAIWGPHRLSQFKSAELVTEFALNGLGVPPES